MQRIAIQPRAGWQAFAEKAGFRFHSIDGETYWDESAYYRFTLRQIEDDLEDPTEELHGMAMDLVADAVRDAELLERLGIPSEWHDAIAASWERGDAHLYGRMDFAYTGNGPAKLLELNYDTPTSLYETGFFQWVWLEDQRLTGGLSADADQFNSLQDKLIEAFAALSLVQPVCFTAVQESEEDRGTITYLADLATQAGHATWLLPIEDIGEVEGQMHTPEGNPIETLFKLYPWEFLIAEPAAKLVHTSRTQWIEPIWKLVLSNKAALVALWERHNGHPNLLPAERLDAAPTGMPPSGWVDKPFFSREGANIRLTTPQGETIRSEGAYGDGGWIRQAYAPLATFGENHAVVGSWVVGDQPAGIGVREDRGRITQDSSRFLPHAIVE